MEHIYGVNVTIGNEVKIEKYNSDKYYNYTVIATHLSNDGRGNGFAQLQFNDTRNKDPKHLISFDWKIESWIPVPFSWSGSTVYPRMTDPTGSVRRVYADQYSKSIYKGLKYAADIKAVFDTLMKYSRYLSWSEYDVHCAVRDKDILISELREQILQLETQILLHKKVT